MIRMHSADDHVAICHHQLHHHCFLLAFNRQHGTSIVFVIEVDFPHNYQ